MRRIERHYDVRDRAAAAKARAELAEFQAELSPQAYQDARLVVTELITNAIRHAPAVGNATISLSVTTEDGALHIEVTDPGSGFEARTDRPPGEHGGRGLVIVHQLADRWGVTADPNTTVWCTVANA